MGSLRQYWWAYLIGVVVVILIALTALIGDTEPDPDVSTSQFLADVQAERVTRIDVHGRTVEYEIEGVPGSHTARLERDDSVRAILADAGIEPGSSHYPTITVDGSDASEIASILLTFIPVIIIIGVLFFFFRQGMKQQNRQPFATLVTNFDPVCRATVNPRGSTPSSTFMDTTFSFCSPEHKDQFDADPTKHLLKK